MPPPPDDEPPYDEPPYDAYDDAAFNEAAYTPDAYLNPGSQTGLSGQTGRGGQNGSGGQNSGGGQNNGGGQFGPGGQAGPNGHGAPGGPGGQSGPEDHSGAAGQDGSAAQGGPAGSAPTPPRRFERPKLVRPNRNDPVAAVERQALECMLQVPRLVPSVETDELPDDAFQTPLFRAIHEAIQGAGGIAVAVGMDPAAWVTLVQDFSPDEAAPMVTELAVAPLPSLEDEVALAKYAAGMVLHIAEGQVAREIADLRTAWQRGEDVGLRLLELEMRKRALAERKHGAT
nr:hypothetical protein [Kineosporia babensis]